MSGFLVRRWLLSSAFPTPLRWLCGFSFVLCMWHCYGDWPCTLGIVLALSWCVILSLRSWLQFASVSLRMFARMFTRDIWVVFPLLFVWLWDQGNVDLIEWDSVLSSSMFLFWGKSLRVGVLHSVLEERPFTICEAFRPQAFLVKIFYFSFPPQLQMGSNIFCLLVGLCF
jgi:hypothetical protein